MQRIGSILAVTAGLLAFGASADPAKEAGARLDEVLAAQPERIKSRYGARHPRQTLRFFGIEPGMTVVEVLPGRGWYTRILLPYLGPSGRLIGADYEFDMLPLFGFFSEERLEARRNWAEQWPEEAEGWRGEDGAAVDAFVLGSMPARLEGSADAILFIRALHNLARFEEQGGYLTSALQEAYRVLAPGGLLGVVQHMAPAGSSPDWADGSNGYLKKRFVIERLEQAGFELIGESDVNLNPKDQPSEQDKVWRLPPTLATSRDDPELREQYRAVGESTRMTLKFRKPR